MLSWVLSWVLACAASSGAGTARHSCSATRKHPPVLSTRLQGGQYDLNAASRDGAYTPLHLAALAGNRHACEALLERGADLTRPSRRGATAIHFGALSAAAQPALQALLVHPACSPGLVKQPGFRQRSALMLVGAARRRLLPTCRHCCWRCSWPLLSSPVPPTHLSRPPPAPPAHLPPRRWCATAKRTWCAGFCWRAPTPARRCPARTASRPCTPARICPGGRGSSAFGWPACRRLSPAGWQAQRWRSPCIPPPIARAHLPACRVGALRALVEAGADVDARSADGVTVAQELFMQARATRPML